jgi:hypothetical protein
MGAKPTTFSDEKTCPACGKQYDKTTFTSDANLNYKVYIHGDVRCKVAHNNVITPRFLIKNGNISTHVDSDLVEGIFSRYCKFVHFVPTTDYDFMFPDAGVAVKRYSVGEFYTGMRDGSVEAAARVMKDRYLKACVLVSGSPTVHASEVLDIVSTDINLKVRQIVGFSASLVSGGSVDVCQDFENDALLSYWAMKYASGIEKRKDK